MTDISHNENHEDSVYISKIFMKTEEGPVGVMNEARWLQSTFAITVLMILGERHVTIIWKPRKACIERKREREREVCRNEDIWHILLFS